MSEFLKRGRSIGAGLALLGGLAVAVPKAQAAGAKAEVAKAVDPNLTYNCEEAALHSVTPTGVYDFFTKKGQESNFFKTYGVEIRNIEVINGGATYGKESCVDVVKRDVYIGGLAAQRGREIIITTPTSHVSFGDEPLKVYVGLSAADKHVVEGSIYGTNTLCANNISAVKEDVTVTVQSTQGGKVYGQTYNLPWVPTHCPVK